LKALLQRVSAAAVTVDGQESGRIGRGLVALVGVAEGDSEADIDYLVSKLLNLRIFDDAGGKFNMSVLDITGELLIISQFTLLADTRRGRRPGFSGAATLQEAARLFQLFVDRATDSGLHVATGRFQAHMHLEIHNDGPVTIMLDSRERAGQNLAPAKGRNDASD